MGDATHFVAPADTPEFRARCERAAEDVAVITSKVVANKGASLPPAVTEWVPPDEPGDEAIVCIVHGEAASVIAKQR